MKKTTVVHERKSRQYRKHPIGRRLIVELLCICLSLVSLPIGQSGYLAEAAQGQNILMFSALPGEIREQTVQTGTDLKELELPQSLEAVCGSLEVETSGELDENSMSEGDSEVENSVLSGMGSELEDFVLTEEGSELENPAASEGGTESTVPEEEPASQEDASAASEEEPTSQEDEPANSEERTDWNQVETLIIEGITWISTPEYDKGREGSYVFTPVLPKSYYLAVGVELPEIVVSVVQVEQEEGEENQKQGVREQRIKKMEAEDELELFAEEGAVPLAEPGCGTISEDTVWEGDVTLADGELVVQPGVTLTVKGTLTVQGNVMVKGGGKIVRGSADACFKAWNGVHLTVGDITLDGASLSSNRSMIEAVKSDVILDDGCIIQNCTKVTLSPWVEYEDLEGNKKNGYGGGAALFLQSGTAVFNDIILENNSSAVGYGGAVFIRCSELRVSEGVYRNNRAANGSNLCGGGCLYNVLSKIYIYGGKFIGNTSNNKGGSIFSVNGRGTETYLYGGYFEGNKSSASGYEGSGAVYYSAYDSMNPQAIGEGAVLELSGGVQFSGDNVQGTGVDGIYLDLSPKGDIARKIQISNTLSYPVTLYLKASEGYVIAEGTNEYRLLHERDMKKINFVDVGGSGKEWYAVLDKEKNQVYLSQNKPDYGCYVYYISNGAEGTVVDDANDGAGYQIGDTATVKSADELEREGYTFLEWNTEADGSGIGYQPGAPLTIEGDTNLYAIFVKGKTLFADFYSGSTGQTERKSIELDAFAESGKITAPQLAEMEGWRSIGWSTDSVGYDGNIAPEDEIILTENKEFYGVYEKDVKFDL